MTFGGGTTEQIRGTVEQANEKGVKVGGRWFNFSQYSKTTVRPAEGDEVELEVARGTFINDAKIVGSGGGGFELPEASGDDEDLFSSTAAAAAPTPRAAAPARGRAATRAEGQTEQARPATFNSDGRNAEIRRLALVKAAAEYSAGRDNLAPEDVVAIAAQWEAWVLGQG